MKEMVLVTYDVGQEEKNVFYEMLKEHAELVFLADLSSIEERIHALSRATVISSCSFSKYEVGVEEIGYLERARFIQLTFSGADNVPFERIPGNIGIASNPGAFAEPIAEHVLALALNLAKKIVPRYLKLSKGDFDQSGYNSMLGGGICGIIGYGGNGKAIGRLFKAIGMKVYGIKRIPVPLDENVDFLGSHEDLDYVLGISDVIVLCVPLTRRTTNLIGEREFSLMKENAILINVARGPVIKQRALFRHLKGHPEFLAAIDTWWMEPSSQGTFSLDFPFFELENIVGSPHVADVVQGMMPSATRKAVSNIISFLNGEKINGELHREDYLRVSTHQDS